MKENENNITVLQAKYTTVEKSLKGNVNFFLIK